MRWEISVFVLPRREIEVSLRPLFTPHGTDKACHPNWRWRRRCSNEDGGTGGCSLIASLVRVITMKCDEAGLGKRLELRLKVQIRAAGLEKCIPGHAALGKVEAGAAVEYGDSGCENVRRY